MNFLFNLNTNIKLIWQITKIVQKKLAYYSRADYIKLEKKLSIFNARKMFGDWEENYSEASSIDTFKSTNSGVLRHNFIQIKEMFDVKAGYSLTLYTLILMLKTRQA